MWILVKLTICTNNDLVIFFQDFETFDLDVRINPQDVMSSPCPTCIFDSHVCQNDCLNSLSCYVTKPMAENQISLVSKFQPLASCPIF